jgi:small-conductance mechanosensitive channel
MPTLIWGIHWKKCRIYKEHYNVILELYKSTLHLLMHTVTWHQFIRYVRNFIHLYVCLKKCLTFLIALSVIGMCACLRSNIDGGLLVLRSQWWLIKLVFKTSFRHGGGDRDLFTENQNNMTWWCCSFITEPALQKLIWIFSGSLEWPLYLNVEYFFFVCVFV